MIALPRSFALINEKAALPDGTAADLAMVVGVASAEDSPSQKVIQKLLPGDQLPADIPRIDVDGRWVTPGLIDIHTHGELRHTFNEPEIAKAAWCQAKTPIWRFTTLISLPGEQSSTTSGYNNLFQQGYPMTPSPIFTTTIEALPIQVYASNSDVGQAAAALASALINEAIQARGQANIILATGNSQLTFLESLRAAPAIDWSKVHVFHMDEYLGLDPDHPASFPRFLRVHFLDHLNPPAGAFYPVLGMQPDPRRICQEYEALLRAHPADLCALGIGENGHLAFNDPPFADFNDRVWMKVVQLDEISRRQQVGEGHFPDLNAVPTHALTLTIPALLAARAVLAIVPEGRKAHAVQRALVGPVDPNCPASILRRNAHARLLLDRDSAALAFPGLPGQDP